jgi:hypothetical protein
MSCGQGFPGLGVFHCISHYPLFDHSRRDHGAFSIAPTPYPVNGACSVRGPVLDARVRGSLNNQYRNDVELQHGGHSRNLSGVPLYRELGFPHAGYLA